jgi:pilus assembly protein Flp/PilA
VWLLDQSHLANFDWRNDRRALLRDLVRSFANNQSGVTAIEYGLICALIAVAAFAGLNAAGTALNTLFTAAVVGLNPH